MCSTNCHTVFNKSTLVARRTRIEPFALSFNLTIHCPLTCNEETFKSRLND